MGVKHAHGRDGEAVLRELPAAGAAEPSCATCSPQVRDLPAAGARDSLNRIPYVLQ